MPAPSGARRPIQKVSNMTKQAVAREVALSEFEAFAEAWDIETDLSKMDEDSRVDFEKLSGRVVSAIEAGRANVGDDGSLNYQLKTAIGDCADVTFHVPKGVDYMAMDAYKDKETVRKLFAFMASITKKNVKLFGSMSGPDFKFAQAVATLFMGS
jgi:hypothetical protein